MEVCILFFQVMLQTMANAMKFLHCDELLINVLKSHLTYKGQVVELYQSLSRSTAILGRNTGSSKFYRPCCIG